MDKARYDREKLLVEAERFEEADNYKMAAKVLLRGAKLGSDSCQLNLGNYYADGTGVRKSRERAAHWYRKAYGNGNSWGAFNLALDELSHGDLRSAERWLKKAVAMRHGGAHLQLAKLHISQGKKTLETQELLRRVLKMSRDEATTDEKAEARSLLQEDKAPPPPASKRKG